MASTNSALAVYWGYWRFFQALHMIIPNPHSSLQSSYYQPQFFLPSCLPSFPSSLPPFSPFSLPPFLKKILFIYFLERGERREIEGERHQCARDIHHLVASHAPLTRDLAFNPGLCPDWELIRQPFGSQAGTQSTEPHQPQQSYFCHCIDNNTWSSEKLNYCLRTQRVSAVELGVKFFPIYTYWIYVLTIL